MPNLGVSVNNKTQTKLTTNDILRILREQLLVVYSAHKPHSVNGYNNIEGQCHPLIYDINNKSHIRSGPICLENKVPPLNSFALSLPEVRELNLIEFGGSLSSSFIPSFHTALILSGGLSVILYMFARVVELSNSDIVQSCALQFLLKIAHSNSEFYTEFTRQNYFSLIGAVIRSEKCSKSINLLNAVLETACSASILSKASDGHTITSSKNVYIIHPELFVSIINHYSDWHLPNADNCDIIETLFSAIQTLVSEKHTYQSLNISRLSHAKLVPAIFNFCKTHLTIDSQQPIFWSKQAAESMVNIIRVFSAAPPAPALLDDIVKVLLMLHNPINTFVTHDRSKFFFLLPSSSSSKKKNSLPLVSRSLSLNANSVDKPNHFNDTLTESSTKNSSDEIVIELSPTMWKCDASKSKAAISCKYSNIERRSNIILNVNEKAKLDRTLSEMSTRRNRKLRRMRRKHKKRNRTMTEVEMERDSKKKRRKRSLSDGGIDLALFREYDIIPDEEFDKSKDMPSASDKEDKYEMDTLDTRLYHGLIHLQKRLLELLRDLILILPDSTIDEVLTHYVTFDITMVLANNKNTDIRTSTIRLITAMCERCISKNINVAKTINFFHLGNQISLYEADYSLVESCIQWVTGTFQSIDQIFQTGQFVVNQKYGLNSLIAILPRTVHDVSLLKITLDFFSQLYSQADNDTCIYMIDSGLIPSSVKTLVKMHEKYAADTKLIEKVEEFLCLIARRAISTAGCINILWDLLNSITYIERNRSGTVYRNLRSTQATILTNLLRAFYSQENNIALWNFKMYELGLSESTLSASEKRTRLELLLDRCIQLIRTADLSHAQTPNELKLIQIIVVLSLSGFSRGGTIIPWSFLPINPMPFKLSIIKILWNHMKCSDALLVGCDTKLMKAMIHSFCQSDRDIILKTDVEVLENVCKSLGIQIHTNNPYIPQAVLKMKLARENSLREQKPGIERAVFKSDTFAMNCVESAMKITRYVVEMQNAERRNAMAYIRIHDESCLKNEWNSIIDRMTHEGAPWYSIRTMKR